MGFLAIANAYTMRVCLSLAITEMVAKPNSTDPNDVWTARLSSVYAIPFENLILVFCHLVLNRPVNSNGISNCRAWFCHRSTLATCWLTYLAAFSPRDSAGNGHLAWAFYRQPDSQCWHQSPLRGAVRTVWLCCEFWWDLVKVPHSQRWVLCWRRGCPKKNAAKLDRLCLAADR